MNQMNGWLKLGMVVLILGIVLIGMGSQCPFGQDVEKNYYTTSGSSGGTPPGQVSDPNPPDGATIDNCVAKGTIYNLSLGTVFATGEAGEKNYSNS